MVALLDAVECVLPTSETAWQKVKSFYNEKYAEKWKRGTRNAKGLKTKYRELVHGSTTGGGKSNDFEKRAKEIEGMINKEGSISVSSPEKKEDAEKKEDDVVVFEGAKMPKGRTRMEFEKKIDEYTDYQREFDSEMKQLTSQQHQEKLNRFDRFLDIFEKLSQKQ